jgi:hypothetical protein
MCPPQSDGYDFFGATNFGDLKFQTYLAPLDFIQSHGSGDAWLFGRSMDEIFSDDRTVKVFSGSLALSDLGFSNLN